MRISDWSSDVCSSDLAQRDARIGDVEDEKGTESAEMQFGDIDDEAVADAVEDVADRAAEDQRQRQHVATRLFARHPKGDGNGAGGERKSTRLNSSHSYAACMPSPGGRQTRIGTAM